MACWFLISALEGQPVGLERQVAGPGALGIAVIRYPVRAEKAFAPHFAEVRQIAAQPHDDAPGEVFCAFSGFRLIHFKGSALKMNAVHGGEGQLGVLTAC